MPVHGLIRRLTPYVVGALALFAAVEGARVASFAVAEMIGGAASAATGRLAAWQNTTGVMAAARWPGRLVLNDNDADQFSRREKRLEAYLAVRPMASSAWLELAELRATMARPRQSIIDAISLSQLTGPLEGTLMFRRAALALLNWDDLPNDVKDRTARDVALVENTPSESFYLKSVIAGRSAAVRDDLRWRLLQVAGLPEARLESLGLR